MKENQSRINFRIKLYLYFVICFVLSVITIEVANSNNLDVNSMFIFVISLIIISLYLIERITSQEALMNTGKVLESESSAEIIKSNVHDHPSKLSNKNDYIKIREEINNLSDEFKILRNEIETKDKEIERFKEGYNSSILKNYFSKFTYLDSLIKEFVDENYIDINGLKDIQTQLGEALAEYDIEMFSPLIGEDYRTAKGVDDVTKRNKITTSDKNKHLKIAEVILPGYRRKIDLSLSDDDVSNFQIISNAVVSIYVFDSENLN